MISRKAQATEAKQFAALLPLSLEYRERGAKRTFWRVRQQQRREVKHNQFKPYIWILISGFSFSWMATFCPLPAGVRLRRPSPSTE